ncbi:MAG TPA: ABC transporter permease [Thermoanaerobaculia bacterium]|nr:ABC transporter permease [Thermoanaerobaculia bacterium]
METLIQDLRYSVRTLLKSPGFATIAVLCIAIGIAANTSIFSVVNAILLRPFPYADPDRIVALHEIQPKNDIDADGFSNLDYQDLRAQATGFSAITAYTQRSLTFSGDGEPERVEGASIAWNLFPFLGVKPAFGRTFHEDEDRPGAPGAVLLSHELWMRRFNGNPDVVNKTILVNAAAHTIVGVMPPRFGFPERQLAWVPLADFVKDSPRSERNLSVLGRLKPGSGLEQARAEVKTVVERIAKQYPDSHTGWSGNARPLREEFTGKEMRLMVLTMLGAVICVLLIACSNVANLLLARATVRQREVAVRAAFGAGRVRIVRQFLTESVVIGLLGGALGVAFAYWGIRWIEVSMPADNPPPYWMRFTIDAPVLLYTLGIAVATGLLFGLAPALQALKTDLHETLKEGGRGGGCSLRRNRLRSGLVVAQVALSLMLLVGASLFVRSFLNLQDERGGLETSHLMSMRIYLPAGRYEKDADMSRRVEDVVRRLEALPGVEAVSASNNIPLGDGGGFGRIAVDGKVFPRGEEPNVFWAGVGPHLLRTLGLEPVSGRGFTDAEGFSLSHVALVNQMFAGKLWPGQDPVGRRFRLLDGDNTEWLSVIGVVADFKNEDIDSKMQPAAYLPYPYQASRNTGLTIRTRFAPEQIVAGARREIRASDPNLPVFDIYTLEQVRQKGVWEYRFLGGMFTVFGFIALFLAAIGVYGVLSYSVSQRVREIGVRVALGAQDGDVMRLVLRQGLLLALFGIAFGLPLAFGASQVLKGVLYNVSPNDPVSFGLISAVLAAIAALASYMPARRALDVDPLDAIRGE